MILKTIIFPLFYTLTGAIIYDSYTGNVATEEQLAKFTEANIISSCTNYIEPCNASEWRRIDGSCNNIKFPSRGAFHTPQYRVLKPEFGKNFEPRTTLRGKPFKLARYIRQKLLQVGKATDDYFSQTASYYTEFMFGDVGSIHDISNYIFDTPYCCEDRGKTDYMCVPNKIPLDDSVHRFSGLKCLNLTRPLSFQNIGCTANDTTPERIDYTTTFFDLSTMYNFLGSNISKLRTFEGGLMTYETVDGGEFPSDANSSCLIQQAIQTGCTRYVPNGLLGTNLFSTWFWRYHNYVARKLADINPCWDDEMLFYTAREINIGFYVQMYYYEFLPLLLGRKKLIKDGIISCDSGYRDMHNSSAVPQMSMEYPYVYRWFHTIQESDQKMYNKDDTYVKEIPMANFTLRVQDLTTNDNFLQLTHGIYIQPGGKFDSVVHPDISEIGLGHLQYAFDIPTADLSKGRYFGFPPYIKYRDHCTKYTKSHKTFEDLLDVISEERLTQLKYVYDDVEDIELMAGVWSERLMEGTRVPPTVYCLLVDQLRRSIVTDYHWYERRDRPHAFTFKQLQEIRKASLARLLCDCGDEVTRVQPSAFRTITAKNKMVNCSEIPSLDITAWKDDSCDAECTS